VKFCYGTCEAVFDYGNKEKYVKDLRNAIVLSVAPEAFGYGVRQNKLSDLAHGQCEVLDEMVDGATSKQPSEIAAHFQNIVMSKMRSERFKVMILALQWLIDKDESIDGDTVVDAVNNLTKRQFLAAKKFLAYKTFAGLFIFAVKLDNNYGCGPDVKLLNSQFFAQFLSRTDEITLEEEPEHIDPNEISTLIGAAQIAIAQVRNDGYCPRCGRPLVYLDEDGIEVDRSTYFVENGKAITLCVECKRAAEVDSTVLVDAWSTQRSAEVQMTLIDLASGNSPSKKEIIEVLMAIDEFLPGDDSGIRDPHTIAEKIPSERGFRKKVEGLILPQYNGVNGILNDLAGKNAITNDQIGYKVQRMWLDTKSATATQEQIFDAIVKRINDKTGRKYKSACEILISYYIQRCDVFAPPR